MMDIATLGFEVRSGGLTDAQKKLLKLVPAARSAETATERFEKRANQMDRTMGAMGSRLNAVTGLFAKFAAIAGTAFSIGAVSRMSDEYTALTNSLKVVVGAQGSVAQIA